MSTIFNIFVGINAESSICDLENLSDETVISTIKNDIKDFNEYFTNELNNDSLTTNEKDILKIYLWWKTKKDNRCFKQELDGMEVDESGSVILIATDEVISSNDNDGVRLYYNEKLSKRGKTSHDALVTFWKMWKEESQMVFKGTKVIKFTSEFTNYRVQK